MQSATRRAPREPAAAQDLNGVVNSLRRIVRAIRVSSHAAEERLGITGAQLFVLQNLAASPASSLGELAGRTLTDQSSVSVVVSRLVRRGLVTRRPSALDGRRVELSLSAAGRALLGRAPELAQTRLVRALRRAPVDELRSVASLLAGVAREMDPGSEPPEMFLERDLEPQARPPTARSRMRRAEPRREARRRPT